MWTFSFEASPLINAKKKKNTSNVNMTIARREAKNILKKLRIEDLVVYPIKNKDIWRGKI